MKLLPFKQKHEDLILNVIDRIETGLYEGEIDYIDPLLDMLIRYAEALDADCIYTNQFQTRLEEAAYWFSRISGEE
jgi:hypothetical protein